MEDRGEGVVEMVGGVMVIEVFYLGVILNRNYFERSYGFLFSLSGNSIICLNREEVRVYFILLMKCLY